MTYKYMTQEEKARAYDKALESKKTTMTIAELNAHWALPDETLGDSYTMTHKREREAFVKGWDKAVELCCDWLKEHTLDYAQELNCGVGKSQPDYYTKHFIEDFQNYMKGE